MRNLRWLCRATVALLVALLSGPLLAQTGMIRIVYTFGAGGTGDIAGRLIAEHMQKALGQPVIVENKVGAGGRIAIEAVKAAAPDGNTLLLTSLGPMAILPYTVGNLRYDPFKDFMAVAHMADSPLALAITANVPARTAAEYVAQVKADPKLGFFGVAPLGGLPHFLGLSFAAMNRIDLTAVGYRGGAQMVQAIASGEVPTIYATPGDLMPMAKAGKVRFLAVSSAGRTPMLPDVPTLKEQGFDIDASTWYGFFAPAGTPAATVARLANAIGAAIKDPAIAKRFVEMGLEPTGSGPDELAKAMRRDYDRWGPVIKASGYKVTD
jgi:tripartite-type tricarboxylate transporter receptor subunit TctC